MGLSLAKVKPSVAVIIPRYWGCLTVEYRPVFTKPFFRVVTNWIAAARKMHSPPTNRLHPKIELRSNPKKAGILILLKTSHLVSQNQ
jgi:hypothetical protein